LKDEQAEMNALRLRCEQFERAEQAERLRRIEDPVAAGFSNASAGAGTQVIIPHLFCRLKTNWLQAIFIFSSLIIHSRVLALYM
jgi:hypothetical protein